jgi:hypothetical protein
VAPASLMRGEPRGERQWGCPATEDSPRFAAERGAARGASIQREPSSANAAARAGSCAGTQAGGEPTGTDRRLTARDWRLIIDNEK